jgi:predicted dienelactone hydrolase
VSGAAGAAVAQAANPFARGPAPTATTLNARGPFAITQVDVSGAGQGFNNATVYYPNDTSQGTFAAIAVSPGFLTPKALMQWAGPKFASHGFVVAVLETNTLFDIPGSRADQMQAVLRYLTGASSPAAVRSRIDPNRLGAMGHSMGGGGALEVGDRNANPRVKAVVGLQPWDIGSFAGLDVPSMIIGATNDWIAPVDQYGEPFYTAATGEKQYIELSGQDHFVGVTDNQIQSRAGIAWFKRYLDNDTRYDQFLCPPVSGAGITETRNTCPT